MTPDLRQAVASLFDRTAETYDALGVEFFGVFARQLLADVGMRPGQRVVDLGCGRGAVLFPAAELTGPRGSVHGIDLSQEMVDRTARDADGLPHVTVDLGDAQRPDLPAGSADVVLASCVLVFLPDPAAALRAWRELLAPGGRLGVTVFGGNDARWQEVTALFQPYVPPAMVRALMDLHGPFASAANLRALAEQQGFDVDLALEREHPVRFDGPEHCIAWSWSHGQRYYWELVPEQERERLHHDVLERLRPLCEPDGSLVMTQRIRYLTANC